MKNILKKIFARKKLLLIIVVVLIGGLIYKNSTTVKVKTVPVKKIQLEKRVVTKTVTASGKVTSEYQADLSFPLGQRVTRINVKEGEQVVRGQLLAILENQSVLQTAQYYKDARDVEIRQKELFVKNEDSNKSELGGQDQYNIRLREYDEEISKAEAQYNAQLASLRSSYIYSPFAGTIVDISKLEGETVAAGEVLIKIADLDKLQFEIDVDQEDYAILKAGMDAEIELDAYPNDQIMGKLLTLPVFAQNTAENTFTINIVFVSDGNRKPILGMTGDSKIVVETSGSEVDSLYYDEIFLDEQNKPFVWVVENGYVTKHPIEIGLEGDIFTEVKSEIQKQMISPMTQDIEIKDGYKANIAR